MTTTTRNETAERLIENAMKIGLIDIRKQMDEALAAERRATVERIRARLTIDGVVQDVGGVYLAKVLEEAAR